MQKQWIKFKDPGIGISEQFHKEKSWQNHYSQSKGRDLRARIYSKFHLEHLIQLLRATDIYVSVKTIKEVSVAISNDKK